MINVRGRRFWDAVLVLALFIGGQQMGSRYMAKYHQTAHGDFYQQDFAPAVMVGCGRPFVDPVTVLPALTQFLDVKTDSFSCDLLPANLVTRDPGFFQAVHRYLMTVVGWQWRWAGKVSWSGLSPLFGLLFGLTLCAAYGLLRLACGPAASLIGVLPLAVSAHHLARLPHLRDYAKAPLFLLLLLALIHITRPPYKKGRSLAWSMGFGALLGVSIGFRIDLVLAIPAFVCAVVCFTPGRMREHLGVKGAALGLAALMFVITAWPILPMYGKQGGTNHISILGLMTAFDEPLAVTRPLYNLGQVYDDTLANAVINSHNIIHGGSFTSLLDRDYENAGGRVLLDYARLFPADVFARGVSATLEVLNFPTTVNEVSPGTPSALTSARTLDFYREQTAFLRRLAGIGPVVVLLSLLIVAAGDLRAGIGLLLLMFYYCGSAATQFHIRNYFHLEFLVWWALIFVISRAAAAVLRLFKRQWPRPSRRVIWNVGLMSAVTAGIVVVPAVTLRAYQQRNVTNLVDDYLRIPRVALPFSTSIVRGHVHVEVEGVWDGQAAVTPLSTQYIVTEFTADHCQAVDLPVRISYQALPADEPTFAILSRVPVSAAGPTLRLVPVYKRADYHFIGFDLPDGYDQCLKSVSRISDLRDVPLLLDLTLDPAWRSGHLYQRLEKWEGDGEPAGARLLAVPDDLVDQTASAIATVVRPRSDEIAVGIAVNSSAGTWFTPEPVKVPSSHELWLNFPAQTLDAASVLRVRGVVRKGGIRIGTTVNGHVIDSRAVLSPGPYTILIGVPEAGAYGVRITDESAATWRREPTSLLRGFVALAAPWVLSDDFELQEVAWVHLPTSHF